MKGLFASTFQSKFSMSLWCMKSDPWLKHLLWSNLPAVAMVAAVSVFGATELKASWALAPCSLERHGGRGYESYRLTAQNGGTGVDEVSADDLERYVSVYKAMQRDRSLTIDQAVKFQGLTVKQFRDLENRVQRDDVALDQARSELQAAAQRETGRAE
jgi:hypothetical protein